MRARVGVLVEDCVNQIFLSGIHATFNRWGNPGQEKPPYRRGWDRGNPEFTKGGWLVSKPRRSIGLGFRMM